MPQEGKGLKEQRIARGAVWAECLVLQGMSVAQRDDEEGKATAEQSMMEEVQQEPRQAMQMGRNGGKCP